MNNQFSIKDWRKYIYNIGLPLPLINIYLKYVRAIYKKNLPVIFEFNHLACLLGRTPTYLASATNATSCHYRTFTIPKRSGGKRTIDAPYPALLECQQWILQHILKQIAVHPAATGFVAGKSILNNAQIHLGGKKLLKIDIKDFFPSISMSRVLGVFNSFGYPPNVSFYLSQLCCLNDVLPQGAATSPYLANVVAYRLDQRLSALAQQLNIAYSRYADDLFFSGDGVSPALIKYVYEILAEEGFLPNEGKTYISGHTKSKKIITGISISNGELTIPRKMKREIKKHCYFIKQFGLMSHLSKLKIRNPNYIYSLYGKIRFWLWVEPQNETAKYYEHFLRTTYLSDS